jgi:hypothetical protein
MEDLEKESLLRRIDRSIFNRIDLFKRSPEYNKIQDSYNNLDEEKQRVVKLSFFGILVILPIIFIATFWWSNHKLSEDLAKRQKLVSQIQEYIAQNQVMDEVGGKYLSGSSINSQSDLTEKISSLITGTGIELNKIQVGKFEQDAISNTMSKTTANIEFQKLSTEQLMTLFINMIQREKFKVSSVKIVRDDQSKLLEGSFNVVHLANTTSTDPANAGFEE